ncbi:MAG: prepilin peptidase [archaeon]
MFEVFFLIALGLIWIVFASVQDLKTHEVANWLSFSLIFFALGFRFFYSLFSDAGFGFFYQGLIGLGIFFILGNAFYYGKIFAGGDAKLMIALGAVLPFSKDFFYNLKIFAVFLFIFLFAGGVYGLIWSIVLAKRNFSNFSGEFLRIFSKNKNLAYSLMIFALILMTAGFLESFLFYFGVLFFLMPYFYIYAKAVDEACMVKRIKTCDLREGDWLYENLNVGRKILKSKWEGLSDEEIKKIRKKYRFVRIRQGIPFVPVFLISFLILIYFYLQNFIIFKVFF